MRFPYIKILITGFVFLFIIGIAPSSVYSYAPSIEISVIDANTGEPLQDVIGLWTAYERDGADEIVEDGTNTSKRNEQIKGTYKRYEPTNENGVIFFERWDIQGFDIQGNDGSRLDQYESVYGRRYVNQDIEVNGQTVPRVSSTNDVPFVVWSFGCWAEEHKLEIILPDAYQGIEVSGRWREADDLNGWTDFDGTSFTLVTAKASGASSSVFSFHNNGDFIAEFTVESSKSFTDSELGEIGDEEGLISDLETVGSDLPENVSELTEEQIAGLKKVPACLTTELCSEENPCKADVPENGRGVKILGLSELHRKLTIGAPQLPIWVAECVKEGDTYACTTGDEEVDTMLFGQSNKKGWYSRTVYSPQGDEYEAEQFKSGVEFAKEGTSNVPDQIEWHTTATTNPFGQNQQTANTGNLHVGNQTPAAQTLSSVFMAFYLPGSEAAPAGMNPSQQQATLTFTTSCNLIIDPYGKVFDSHTLEPLADASVELTTRRDDGSFTFLRDEEVIASITNPYQTDMTGSYSFLVPSGQYRLTAEAEGYRFPPVNLHPQAEQLYGSVYDGGTIVVEDEMVEANIPMEPVDIESSVAYARQNPVQVVSHFQSINKSTNQYEIEGVASHPKAVVEVFATVPDTDRPGRMKRTRSLANTTADAQGVFALTIDMASLKTDETVGELEVRKPDLLQSGDHRPQSFLDTVGSFFAGLIGVSAADRDATTTVITLNPVMNYISGYAVVEDGTILPRATVGVYLPSSQIPVYETLADEDGYFEITSEYLPSVPYELRYTSINGTEIAASTGEFIARNTAVETEATRYFAFQPSAENAEVMGAFVAQNQPSDGTMLADSDFLTITDGSEMAGENGAQNRTQAIIVGVIVMVLVVVSVSLVGIFLARMQPKRKKKR